MYLKWLCLLPVMLVVTAATFPLAFILPFFAQYREGWHDNGNIYGYGYYLPNCIDWFQTPDNSLDGDYGWQHEHWQWRFKLSAKLATYIGRVGWLWRNPGYGFGLVELTGEPIEATYSGDLAVNDDPGHEGSCTIKCNDIFQYVKVKKLWANKSLYLNFGWNIKGLVNSNSKRHIATFAFSPRLSKFVE